MDNIQEGTNNPAQTITSGISQTLTPMPKIQGKPMTMDFPDAMREVIKGNKVARIEWGNFDYGFLKDEWLTIFTKGKFHTWLVNDGDLNAQDWIVVKETNAAS